MRPCMGTPITHTCKSTIYMWSSARPKPGPCAWSDHSHTSTLPSYTIYKGIDLRNEDTLSRHLCQDTHAWKNLYRPLDNATTRGSCRSRRRCESETLVRVPWKMGEGYGKEEDYVWKWEGRRRRWEGVKPCLNAHIISPWIQSIMMHVEREREREPIHDSPPKWIERTPSIKLNLFAFSAPVFLPWIEKGPI